MDRCEGLVSDHSLLRATINYSVLNASAPQSEPDRTKCPNTSANPNSRSDLPQRFRTSNIPDEFMYSEKTVESCMDIIHELLTLRLNQEKLDKICANSLH